MFITVRLHHGRLRGSRSHFFIWTWRPYKIGDSIRQQLSRTVQLVGLCPRTPFSGRFVPILPPGLRPGLRWMFDPRHLIPNQPSLFQNPGSATAVLFHLYRYSAAVNTVPYRTTWSWYSVLWRVACYVWHNEEGLEGVTIAAPIYYHSIIIANFSYVQ